MEQTRRASSTEGAIEIWEGEQSLLIFLSSPFVPLISHALTQCKIVREGRGKGEAVWLGFLQTFLG